MTKNVFITKWSSLATGQDADLSLVPPASRRRLSPLQKIYFSLSSRLATTEYATAVFATQNGEDSVTRRLVEDFNFDGSVSPQRFSASVYNAAPGLWSICSSNRSNYTAIAAGVDSLEAGLLESLTSQMPTLSVYAEETDGGCGVGVLFSSEGGGDEVEVNFVANPSAQTMSYDDFVKFLSASCNEITGRYITLKRILRG